MNEETTPSDGGSTNDKGRPRPVEQNIKERSTWLRLFFMLVVVILSGVSSMVTGAVVLLQFFWVLFTGETNKKLEQLGQSLATYMYEIVRYLTFNTEQRPFPFDAEWPAGPP
jgi:hypothetical protein